MSTSLTTNNPPYEVEELPGVLRLYSDGSIVRSFKPLLDVPVNDDGSIVWKEVLFDTTKNLYLRLYKPVSTLINTKLPIFYYIPGGGFCIGMGMWPNFQNDCFRLASELQAIVIAPDYRLALEHRLPAAIEDVYTAVKWLKDQAVSENPDAWLNDVADFGRVFISGDFAGTNIAHNLAVLLGAGSEKLTPVRVRGYVLMEPFFGGTILTKAEAEGSKEAQLNLEFIDKFWKLSIPVEATKDHPMVNPFGPDIPLMETLELDPILVVVGSSDLLKDRVEEYASKLKARGKKIKYIEYENKQHDFFTLDPYCEASINFMQATKKFIAENSF
ncbi:hypothetical protein GIB67_034295 [Kingdonia uniflora]|uniref:Alpha/beta hydrolase fold-3 domain-containing protein n=1 Tax=Kingdonia uniflora TaxID=39325 RepID=A0A7J7NS31_9MAGN|nr:hypothetical protein GIB67_034295 [Kingdonia uniflora]